MLMNQLTALKDFIPNSTQLAANTIIARLSTSDILDSCINFEKVCSQKKKMYSKKHFIWLIILIFNYNFIPYRTTVEN